MAALEREVRPLVKHWRVSEKQHEGRRFQFFENDRAVLVCGGVGPEPARRAAEAVMAFYPTGAIYSVGYAGALHASLKVGQMLYPSRVINASDGSSLALADGNGILVSYPQVAGPEQKSKLRESYAAQAVDMEAAAVACAAALRGVEFRALKVISDEFDYRFPATERFVDSAGRFQECRFAWFVAVRPWLWPQVIQLARNSKRASKVLCAHLAEVCGEPIPPAEL